METCNCALSGKKARKEKSHKRPCFAVLEKEGTKTTSRVFHNCRSQPIPTSRRREEGTLVCDDCGMTYLNCPGLSSGTSVYKRYNYQHGDIKFYFCQRCLPLQKPMDDAAVPVEVLMLNGMIFDKSNYYPRYCDYKTLGCVGCSGSNIKIGPGPNQGIRVYSYLNTRAGSYCEPCWRDREILKEYDLSGPESAIVYLN